jgi:hypothetical protein
VPRLVLGDLVAFDAEVAVVPDVPALNDGGVIGQSLLSHFTWEIDWDRGLVTLGAAPWPRGGGTVEVPLHHMEVGMDEALVEVDGTPIPMLLDTGLFASSISNELARKLHLPKRPADAALAEHRPVGLAGDIGANGIYAGDLRMGSVVLRAHPFVAVDRTFPAILGRDVLSQFNMQVIPGQRLLLRPRGDPRATARARIARWPGFGACASPGCATAEILPLGDATIIYVRFESAVGGPFWFVLGCAGSSGTGERLLTQSERAFLDSAPSTHYFTINITASQAGLRGFDASSFGRDWFAPGRGGCRELTVVDVVPLPSPPPATPGRQR